jgi:hypothetical protein
VTISNREHAMIETYDLVAIGSGPAGGSAAGWRFSWPPVGGDEKARGGTVTTTAGANKTLRKRPLLVRIP